MASRGNILRLQYIEREYTIGSNYLMITSEHTVNEIEIAKQKRRRSNPPASPSHRW